MSIRYRLIAVPVQFWPGFREGIRVFEAANDEAAIFAAERLDSPALWTYPLKFVRPDGSGVCNARPTKLLEVETGRVVKTW